MPNHTNTRGYQTAAIMLEKNLEYIYTATKKQDQKSMHPAHSQL